MDLSDAIYKFTEEMNKMLDSAIGLADDVVDAFDPDDDADGNRKRLESAVKDVKDAVEEARRLLD